MSEPAPHVEPPAGDLLATALALVAAEGWRAYGPAKLARRAGVGLAEACLQLPDGGAILQALGRRADMAMLDLDVDELLEMTPKERVFELVMRRLDAIEVARPALQRLRQDGPSEVWACAALGVGRAMKLLVEATGAAPGGVRGLVAGAAVGSAYLRTARVWIDDESADKALTMAELDKRLDQVVGVLERAAG